MVTVEVSPLLLPEDIPTFYRLNLITLHLLFPIPHPLETHRVHHLEHLVEDQT